MVTPCFGAIVCLSVRPSANLSITSWHCTETANVVVTAKMLDVFTQITTFEGHVALLFMLVISQQ